MFKELNNRILKEASKLKYSVSSVAPSTAHDLFNTSTQVVWNGASNNTIWNDETVNFAFRALHDALHLTTRLDFTIDAEIAIGRIQANQFEGILADIVYIETSGQAEFYKLNGTFVSDQREFTLTKMKGVLK